MSNNRYRSGEPQSYGQRFCVCQVADEGFPARGGERPQILRAPAEHPNLLTPD